MSCPGGPPCPAHSCFVPQAKVLCCSSLPVPGLAVVCLCSEGGGVHVESSVTAPVKIQGAKVVKSLKTLTLCEAARKAEVEGGAQISSIVVFGL